MDGPIIRYARTSDGVDIAYGEFPGEGTPILWVPSHGSLSIGAYRKIPSLLEYCENMRGGAPMCVLDTRGTGLSGPLRDEPSVDQYARDIAAVADAVGVPFHLFSLFGGCHAAARYAAEQPARVLSFTMLNPLHGELLARRGYIDFLEKDFESGVLWLVQFVFDLRDDVRAHDVAAEYIRGFSEQLFRRMAEPSVNAAVTLTEDLLRLKASVLVLGEDHAAYEQARETAALLPGSTFAEVRLMPFDAASGRAVRERFGRFLESTSRHAVDSNAPGAEHGLTDREMDVLGLLAEGKRNAEIAEALTLSVRTVEHHVATIMAKTGASNRTEAAMWALHNGLPASPNGLSPRERDVLFLLAAGKTNAQIAETLTLSNATVATHVSHILQKTGSANRAEASAYAVRNGLA